ncbi:hypothetical protein GcM3_014032, partial [Golovinomyces cichoracearum]
MESTSIVSFVTLWALCSTRSINMTNIIRLDGQDTYNLWASTMTAIFRSLKLHETVIQGLLPPLNASDDEVKAYHCLNDSALAIIIQVVNPDVLKCIVDMDTPHLMWLHLKSLYQRNTAYALVHQLGSLCQLAWTFDTSKPISEFIQRFESEWFQLHRLARDSTDSYRQEFGTFLGNDKAKRDFLLGMLSRHCKNVVDNLTTKDDLSFTDVKQRLLDCDYESNNSALLTREASKPGKVKGQRKQGRNWRKPERVQKAVTECTYCRKHHPSLPRNHLYTDCNRLKEYRKPQ